jgi:hypothetical protein
MHVPPTWRPSIRAVRRPPSAKALASGLPAWPAPMTMASYFWVVVMCVVSGVVSGEGIYHARDFGYE